MSDRKCPWCSAPITEVLTSAPPRCPKCKGQLGPLEIGTFPWPPPGPEETPPAYVSPDNALVRALRKKR